jgi:hypothetical protein
LEKILSDFVNVLFIFLSPGPYGSKSPRKGGEDPQLQLMVAKTAALRFEELLVPQLDRLVPPLRLKAELEKNPDFFFLNQSSGFFSFFDFLLFFCFFLFLYLPRRESF